MTTEITVPRLGSGHLRYAIDRTRMEVLSLEGELSGHYAKGELAEEIRDLAKRLIDLTRADKGHLDGDLRPERAKEAA